MVHGSRFRVSVDLRPQYFFLLPSIYYSLFTTLNL
jgi:hypothetical protein